MEEFDFEELLQESLKIYQTIHLSSLEEQAQYAPLETRKIDPQVCREKATSLKETPFDQWTTSSVGTIAYLALHAPNSRKIFREALKEYRSYRIQHPELKFPKYSKESLGTSEAFHILWDMMMDVLQRPVQYKL